MKVEIILPPEPTIQSLMDYIFDNYLELDDFCKIEGKSKNAIECGDCHHSSYFGTGNPKYNCDNFKRIYLVRFLPRQFEQSNFVIKKHALAQIKNKKDLSAVSLGGGPAPETLALLENLCSCKGDYHLYFDNIESEASWEDIYQDISYQFASYVKNIKLEITFSCYSIADYTPQKQNVHDIVFTSWLFSDMRGQNNSNVLQVAKDLVAPHGFIFIMDRYEIALVSRISHFINAARGLTLVEFGTETFKNIVDYPNDVWSTFGPVYTCKFAYWVLQSSK